MDAGVHAGGIDVSPGHLRDSVVLGSMPSDPHRAGNRKPETVNGEVTGQGGEYGRPVMGPTVVSRS